MQLIVIVLAMCQILMAIVSEVLTLYVIYWNHQLQKLAFTFDLDWNPKAKGYT